MKKIRTNFKGLYFIESKKFLDNRGFFREVFLEKIIKRKLLFGCISKSKKNVLRGIHIQKKNPQLKVITVVKGKIFDVAIDLRPNSKTFKKVFTSILKDNHGRSLVIPEGFGHGFLSLADETFVYYLCSKYREKKHEKGIIWNDEDIKIKWPTNKPILSKKDKINSTLKEYIKNYVKVEK